MRYVYHSSIPTRSGFKSIEVFHLPPDRISCEYSTSSRIDSASHLLNTVFADSQIWFKDNYGRAFDRYSIEDGTNMKPRMYADPRLIEALEILGIPSSEVQKVYLPWWIEPTVTQVGSKLDGRLHLIFGASHSYLTQAMQQGLSLPDVCSVTLAGFVHTSDDKIVIGLRGGANFPNTYYFSAGSLTTHAISEIGGSSISGYFIGGELRKEYGLRASDVSDCELLCRLSQATGSKDVSYVFAVKTALTLSEVLERYSSNQDPDKKEHNILLGLSPKDVESFVRQNYRGLVQNNQRRPDDQRVLLPQGAAPLLAYVGARIDFLDSLASMYIQPI